MKNAFFDHRMYFWPRIDFWAKNWLLGSGFLKTPTRVVWWLLACHFISHLKKKVFKVTHWWLGG